MIRLTHLAAAAALLTPTLAPATQPVDAAALAPLEGRQLAPGIHLLGTSPTFAGSAIGNVIVIEQSNGVVLIDSGSTDAEGRRVVAYVRSLTDKPVKALVFTHWHNDHPIGASEIRAAWPNVRIISTARTRASLISASSRFAALGRPDARMDTIGLNSTSATIAQFEAVARNPELDATTRARYGTLIANLRVRMAELPGSYIVLPTRTFTDRLRLDDPVRPVQLMFLGRANTDGDAIAWLPNERIVIAGDVVVSPSPFGFFSYPADWIQVLERLKAMNYSMLVPGHGEPMTDTVYLDRLIGTLTDVRTQVGALVRQGLTLEQVRERVDYSAQTAIFGTTPGLRRGFEANWLTPITQSAYLEARGEPIVQGGN